MNQAPLRVEGFGLGFEPKRAFLAEHRAGRDYDLHLHVLGLGSALVEPRAQTRVHMYGSDHSAVLGRRDGSPIRRWDVFSGPYRFTLPPGLAVLATLKADVQWELVVPTTPVSKLLILLPPTSGNRLALPDASQFAYSTASMTVVDVGEQLDDAKLDALIEGLVKGDRRLLARAERKGDGGQIRTADFSARDRKGAPARERWYFIPIAPDRLVTFVCQAQPQDYADATPLADKTADSFTQSASLG